MSTRLILLRHGETDLNTTGCFLGDLDIPLSSKSDHVLKNIANFFQFPIAAIVSSPLIRASQTANIINTELNIPIIIEPDLKEISFGLWEGKTSKEVAPEILAQWTSRNVVPTTGPTNGETLEHLGNRVEICLNRICESYPNETIVVVTHTYVIKAALDRAMELPNGYHANRLWLETGSVTIIDWNLNSDKRIVHRVNWTPNLRVRSGLKKS